MRNSLGFGLALLRTLARPLGPQAVVRSLRQRVPMMTPMSDLLDRAGSVVVRQERARVVGGKILPLHAGSRVVS